MTDESGGRLVREQLAWERDFTQIPNAYARDKNLSWCARGILAWLMTHAAGYEVTMGGIEASSWKEGREAVRSAVAELEKHGYLHRQRKRGAGGRLSGYLFHLRDPHRLPLAGVPQLPLAGLEPVDNSPRTIDGIPSAGLDSGTTERRVTGDGEPSTYKNTNLRTHKDPAQPQMEGRRVVSNGACGHRLIDDRHCEIGCPPQRIQEPA